MSSYLSSLRLSIISESDHLCYANRGATHLQSSVRSLSIVDQYQLPVKVRMGLRPAITSNLMLGERASRTPLTPQRRAEALVLGWNPLSTQLLEIRWEATRGSNIESNRLRQARQVSAMMGTSRSYSQHAPRQVHPKPKVQFLREI